MFIKKIVLLLDKYPIKFRIRTMTSSFTFAFLSSRPVLTSSDCSYGIQSIIYSRRHLLLTYFFVKRAVAFHYGALKKTKVISVGIVKVCHTN